MAIVLSGTTGIDAGSLPVANTGKISAGAGLPVILNTAGVDRVTVDTAGNVGIGTVPTRKFEVYGSVPSIKISDSNAKSGIQGSIAKIEFAQHYGVNTSSSIEGYQDGTATDYLKGGLKFLTSNGTTLNEAMRIDIYGNILVTNSTGGLGYGTGAGGTVTQLTNKSTAVTLNKPSGQIIMNNAALAAGGSVTFQFYNSLLAATDNIIITIGNAAGAERYVCECRWLSDGYCYFTVTNKNGISYSEGVKINFAIIKGAQA